MEKPTRKPVAVSTTVFEGQHRISQCIVIICDDGSIWTNRRGSGWDREADIPQDDEYPYY